MNIQSLARPNILNMQAYSSGKSEYAGDAQIFLDTNENPYGDSVINRYPDPLQQKLVQRIVEIKSGQFDTTLTPENFALGNGSDEFIDQFVRIFCEPRQDALVYCPPTFGMYQVAAGLNDVTVFPVPLDEDFDLDVEGVLALNGTAKLLFLCSPNNPTGNRMSPERLTAVIANWQGIVVLDEAYIDFCPQFSMVPRLSQFPNLAIMQTFSKAWGMAGVRLGTAIASPEIIALLQKVKMPYNIGALKENFVLEKLADLSRFDRERHAILQEKERLFAVLQPLCVKVFASDANFLLVRLKDGHKAYAYLRDHGVIVRNFSSRPRLANCLRITIGTPAENDRLISLLTAIS